MRSKSAGATRTGARIWPGRIRAGCMRCGEIKTDTHFSISKRVQSFKPSTFLFFFSLSIVTTPRTVGKKDNMGSQKTSDQMHCRAEACRLFPTTVKITPRAPPYIYIYIYIYNVRLRGNFSWHFKIFALLYNTEYWIRNANAILRILTRSATQHNATL